MSNIVFLADVPDAVTPTTIYGKDHQGAFTDEVQIAAWRTQGKVAYMGAPPPRNIGPTALGTTTATIGWTVDGPCTSTRIEYGTTTAYGTNVNGSPLTGGGAVTAALSSLTTGTTYHYRIQIVVGTSTTYTPDLTFRTN